MSSAFFATGAIFGLGLFLSDIFSYLSFYSAEQRLYLVVRWPGLDRATGLGIKMKKYRFDKSIPFDFMFGYPCWPVYWLKAGANF